MSAYRSAGGRPDSCAAAVAPADVPMSRSDCATSMPAAAGPATTPMSQALPAAPPPRTSAVPIRCAGVSRGVVRWSVRSMSSPSGRAGRSLRRLDQPRVRGLQRSPGAGVAVTGLTSSRRVVPGRYSLGAAPGYAVAAALVSPQRRRSSQTAGANLPAAGAPPPCRVAVFKCTPSPTRV